MRPRHHRRIDKSALFSCDPSVWFIQFISWDSHHYHSPWWGKQDPKAFLEKSNEQTNKYGFPHSIFKKVTPVFQDVEINCIFLRGRYLVSTVWMRQVKKNTFRVFCFAVFSITKHANSNILLKWAVPLVPAAYSTVAGTLRVRTLDWTRLCYSLAISKTKISKLAVKRTWQVSTIHIVSLTQRIHKSRSNNHLCCRFSDTCQPVRYTFNNKTSAQQSSFRGGPLIHKPSHQFGVFGNPFPWKHLPIQCRRHDTSHSSRTSPPIQPLTRSECFRSSLCGYPVPKTNCPWTPGVTMVGRWQQRRTKGSKRSLETNHMKSTAATHV